MAGLNLPEMEAGRAVGLVYSLYVDDACSGWSARAEVRQKLDTALKEGAAALRVQLAVQYGEPGKSMKEILTAPGAPYDRETWGKLPEHQAGLRRAMELVGGSADGGAS